ncbi:MEP24 [Ectocarpus sp. CCAP 1310/34]|nr:MEP24 [Ectocarpus sp. CCAP 1310/34]
MQDTGMALLESINADIYNNEFSSVKFGIRLSLGSSDNHVHENLFEEGSDEPTDGVSDGHPSDNLFGNKRILNAAKGVKIKEGDDAVITGENE